MPTYEYQCEQCGHHFEQFQSITDRALRKCPMCGMNKLQRLIGSGAALIFKGSGFYQTDYRSESYQKAAQAEKEKTTPDKAKAKEGTGKKKSEKNSDKKPV